MKRVIAGSIGLIFWCVFSEASEVKVIKGPYLQMLTTDGVTVVWETNAPAAGLVEYGPPGQWTHRAEAAQPNTIQEVRLTGLQAETTYHYRVVIGQTTVGPFPFQTAVKPETPYRFVVYGDSRTNPTIHAAIAEAIAAHRPAFFINTGDLVSSGDIYEQWGPQHFEPLAKLTCSVPLYPVLGNHEGSGKLYLQFFSLPPPEWYYSFSFGNAKFVVIDTNLRQLNWLAPDSEQIRWTVKELTDKKTTWTFVSFHHPPFSSHPGRDPNPPFLRPLCSILEKHRVDVVFNGHNHNYERIYPMYGQKRDDQEGVHYVITGGGGAPLYPVEGDWFTVTCEKVNNYTVVDVNGPVCTLVAYALDGRVLDRFSLCKDEGYLTKLADQAKSATGAARVQVVERLSTFFGPKVPTLLAAFVSDPDVAVRRAVAEGLGRLAMSDGRQTALALIGDSDARVRQGAALAAARTSGLDQADVVKRLLKDPDPGVRRNAAWFFVHTSGAGVLELALVAMDDTEPDVRRRALRAIRDVRDAAAVPLLAKGVADEDRAVALTAIAHAVRDKHVPTLLDNLIKATRHKEGDVRLEAIKALATGGGERRVVIPILIEALNDSYDRVQGYAVGTLERLTGKRFGYDQQKWRTWWSEQK